MSHHTLIKCRKIFNILMIYLMFDATAGYGIRNTGDDTFSKCIKLLSFFISYKKFDICDSPFDANIAYVSKRGKTAACKQIANTKICSRKTTILRNRAINEYQSKTMTKGKWNQIILRTQSHAIFSNCLNWNEFVVFFFFLASYSLLLVFLFPKWFVFHTKHWRQHKTVANRKTKDFIIYCLMNKI